MRNFGWLFHDRAMQQPGVEAVVQAEVRLTYGELEERCARVARAGVAFRAEAGERVGILFENDWRFPELLFGFMRAGWIAVPLNPRWSDETLALVVRDSGCRLLIAGPGLERRSEALLERSGNTELTLVTTGEDAGYESFLAHGSQGTDPAGDAAGDDVSLMPYTTGSTGLPKGVLLTHQGLWWNVERILETINPEPGERGLVVVPVCHKNALIAAIKPLLSAGGVLVFERRFEARAALATIRREGITYLTGVPAIYEDLIREAEREPTLRPTTLRFGLCGSATVPSSLFGRARRSLGIVLAESYGLTEIACPIGNRRGAELRSGSCGRVNPGIELVLRARDSDPDSTSGELWVKGPGLCSGYWHRPEVERERWRDGWFRTGDQFRRDADGYFFFVGRNDDMINVAGENVYPREVESIILRAESVREVIVVGVSHPKKGSVPVAFVVSRDGAAIDEDAIRALFFEDGPAYAHPRVIFVVDSFPLNASGKPDRRQLQAWAQATGIGKSFIDRRTETIQS